MLQLWAWQWWIRGWGTVEYHLYEWSTSNHSSECARRWNSALQVRAIVSVTTASMQQLPTGGCIVWAQCLHRQTDISLKNLLCHCCCCTAVLSLTCLEFYTWQFLWREQWTHWLIGIWIVSLVQRSKVKTSRWMITKRIQSDNWLSPLLTHQRL